MSFGDSCLSGEFVQLHMAQIKLRSSKITLVYPPFLERKLTHPYDRAKHQIFARAHLVNDGRHNEQQNRNNNGYTRYWVMEEKQNTGDKNIYK